MAGYARMELPFPKVIFLQLSSHKNKNKKPQILSYVLSWLSMYFILYILPMHGLRHFSFSPGCWNETYTTPYSWSPQRFLVTLAVGMREQVHKQAFFRIHESYRYLEVRVQKFLPLWCVCWEGMFRKRNIIFFQHLKPKFLKLWSADLPTPETPTLP